MKREEVIVPREEIARQGEFQERIKAMFAARGAHPLARVETFGCPNVRV